jgi:Tfp pilus assembly protein PilV
MLKQCGITLLEVLAAIFVVSIGLLGVLAVIPFGAFQVSKARDAEYASNMLANAVEEIVIKKMAIPSAWGETSWDEWNDTEFVWCEPYEEIHSFTHIHHICSPTSVEKWLEIMRGQDDLVYTSYADKRPDFAGQNDEIKSSGKYTWFFTFLPQTGEDKADVDVLACYNRVPSDDMQAKPTDISLSPGGSRFAFSGPNANRLTERLSETKHVFVTWETDAAAGQVEGGTWCRIVFLDKSVSMKPQVVVTGNLRNAKNNIQVYIPNGVLYHKRVEDVPITP